MLRIRLKWHITYRGSALKNAVFSIIIAVVLSLLTIAAAEGVYSVVRWGKPHRSLSYQFLALAGLVGDKGDDTAAYKPYFANLDDLAQLLPQIKEGGVGIGNSPINTKTEDAAIKTVDAKGCPIIKPNMHKVAYFLHSSTVNPFESISVFHDADKQLDPRLTEFFGRYGGPRATLTSNADGERITVPDVEADRVVLVAGDSMAFGAMVDDDVTIASRLQATDSARRYVNLGVPGVDADQIICRLEDAAKRYAGRIDELIYVYCENDFKPGSPYGSPKEVIAWLKDFAGREKIGKVSVIFAPMIYMVAPELTRIDGTEGGRYPRHEELRAELKGLVEAAGYRWVDIGTLAREEEDRQKTHFGVLSFFVDNGHPSPLGTQRIVERLLSVAQ